MELFALILKATAFLLVLIAAFEDIRHMRIRNDLCIAVAALFIPYAFSLPMPEVLQHLACGAILFAATAALFFFRAIGGGDAKMLAALGLWLTFTTLPLFLVAMSVAGGGLALVAILLRKSGALTKIALRAPRFIGPEEGWLASLARGETVVPYGVAIAIATAITFF